MLVGKMLRMLLFQWSEAKLVEMGESPRLLRHQMENAWSIPDVSRTKDSSAGCGGTPQFHPFALCLLVSALCSGTPC